MTKVCTKCKQEKSTAEFYPRPNGRFASMCKVCNRIATKKYEQSEKGKAARKRYNSSKKGRAANARHDRTEKRKTDKTRNMKKFTLLQHNLTPDEFNKKFNEQNGCCAICGRHQSEFKRGFAVDHDHITGKNRDLLCGQCNLNLHVLENKWFIERGNAYLEKHRC